MVWFSSTKVGPALIQVVDTIFTVVEGLYIFIAIELKHLPEYYNPKEGHCSNKKLFQGFA